MGKDYIPVKDGSFLIWTQNFAKNLKANATALKLDSKMVTEIQSLAAKFKTNLEKALDPEHTHMDVIHKNESKKELKKRIRCMVMTNLNYNTAMTPVLRSAMGLNPREYFRSQPHKPADRPMIELRPGIRKMTVWYRDEASGRRSKPKGVRGITFHWALLNEPPESLENLNKTVSKTSGPLTLEFEEDQRGKVLYISASWENSIGELGPWSEIAKTYIA